MYRQTRTPNIQNEQVRSTSFKKNNNNNNHNSKNFDETADGRVCQSKRVGWRFVLKSAKEICVT